MHPRAGAPHGMSFFCLEGAGQHGCEAGISGIPDIVDAPLAFMQPCGAQRIGQASA